MKEAYKAPGHRKAQAQVPLRKMHSQQKEGAHNEGMRANLPYPHTIKEMQGS
jgi:hypothetical protein